MSSYAHKNRTQWMANYYPEHMRARKYVYSETQQLFAPFAKELDVLDVELQKNALNRFPQSNLLNSIDVVYTMPKTETGEVLYYDGLQDILTKSNAPTVEEWWYGTTPGMATVGVSDYEVSSVLSDSPLVRKSDVKVKFAQPSNVFINLESDNGIFVNKYNSNEVEMTRVTISGSDEFGVNRSEDFYFIKPSYFTSNFKWSYIHSVECVYFDTPSNFVLNISNSPSVLPDYRIFDITGTPERLSNVLYARKSETAGMIDVFRDSARNGMDYNSGVRSEEFVTTYKLSDVDSIDTFAIDHLNKKLYVLDGVTLHRFSVLDEYPSVVKRASMVRTTTPVLDISIEERGAGFVTFKPVYSHFRVGTTISSYKITVIDGSNIYAWNGSSFVLTPSPSWTTNTYLDSSIPSVTYSVPAGFFSNDLILRVDCRLTDDTVETDTYIIEKQIKNPEFSLTVDYTTDPVLFVDNRNRLCVIDNRLFGVIELLNTTYIEDADRGLFIFSYDYSDSLFIDDMYAVTFTPHNVFNELDQISYLSVPRLLGEKNKDYVLRLMDGVYNPGNSSLSGIISGVSREIGLPVKEAFTLSYSGELDFKVEIKYPYMHLIVGSNNHSFNLFTYETIGDLLTDINYLDIDGLAMYDAPDISGELARSLFNQSSEKDSSGLTFYNRTIIDIPLDYNYKVVPGSVNISGFENSETVSYTDDLDKNIFSVNLADNKIYTNKPLTVDNKVSFKSRTNSFVVKYCPVVISAPIDMMDSIVTNDVLSKYASDVIGEANKINPILWSK